jgi:hypothetical protein
VVTPGDSPEAASPSVEDQSRSETTYGSDWSTSQRLPVQTQSTARGRSLLGHLRERGRFVVDGENCDIH